MKRALDVLYRLRKRLRRLFRPRTLGVKVMLFNASGELVLIRNTYGRTDLFVLPGGGVKRFEAPEQAAVREIGEELGCRVDNLAFLSTHESAAEGRSDTVHLFKAIADGEPRADRIEVEEARFFALDDLPAATSPATRRRIEEYLGRRPADGRW
ncbi:MAG TPA: NUDIX domain-containing protein [Thermoanaerobaculia bacterium]|nr:NUDIX domain-containing protein [Thermoanaerobaculia bacterium]